MALGVVVMWVVLVGVEMGGAVAPSRDAHLSGDEAVAKMGHPDLGHPPMGVGPPAHLIHGPSATSIDYQNDFG